MDNLNNQANTKEVLINERKLGWFALLFLLTIILFIFFPFTLTWGWQTVKYNGNKLLSDLLILIIPIIILHEGLHGLFWFIAIKGKYKQIRFGFNRKMLAPYTHCKIPMSKAAYLIGGLAPFFIMGLFPCIISFIVGNAYFFLLSLFGMWSASGDIISCFSLRNIPSNYKIQDHPQKLGFIVIEEENT